MGESTYEKSNKKLTASGIAAGVVGIVVGRYAGIHLVIPAAFTSAIWWAAKKFLPEPKKVLIPALSVQLGHVLWMLLGSIIAGGLAQNALDMLLIVCGLVWLYRSPGRGALYLLGAYQLFSILYNASVFFNAELGSLMHKALLVHIIWRGMALFYMGKLFLERRKLVSWPDTIVEDSGLNG